MPLLAALLGIPLGDRHVMPPLTSDALKRRTLEALAGQLVALARIKPVWWLVEDVHWVDPTTRELIDMCLERIRDLPVFVLITFRPEFVPAWGHMPHVTALTLNRLARRQCTELVDSLCGGKALPAEVHEQIIARTDGVPLFVEELTKTVLESGLLVERDGGYALTGPLPPMAIPATLQDSLMARLDRLSPVKEVAQIGAAIGREFSYELLAAVAEVKDNELKEALTRLATAELVFVRGEPPEATYVFKHALVQDAAYASLLRARRQQIHARIAQVLAEKYPDLAARRPEVLAHHCEAAGLRAASQGVLEPRRSAGDRQLDLRRSHQSCGAGAGAGGQGAAVRGAHARGSRAAPRPWCGDGGAEGAGLGRARPGGRGSPQGQRAIGRRCAALSCPLGRLDVPLRGRQPARSFRARRHPGGDGQ